MRYAFISLFTVCLLQGSLCVKGQAGSMVWTAKEIQFGKVADKKSVKIYKIGPQIPKTARPLLRAPYFSGKANPVKPLFVRAPDADFYCRQLGFVCQKELQLQKVTGLPVYFRLGSKQQADMLEGK